LLPQYRKRFACPEQLFASPELFILAVADQLRVRYTMSSQFRRRKPLGPTNSISPKQERYFQRNWFMKAIRKIWRGVCGRCRRIWPKWFNTNKRSKKIKTAEEAVGGSRLVWDGCLDGGGIVVTLVLEEFFFVYLLVKFPL
jgi:hypothetical protein